jgi:GDP-L-fucose synthase
MNAFWHSKKVLVTGGAGFLGSHVVERLRSLRPHELTVVRRRDYDLTREADVARLFYDRRPDIVLHLAGLVGGILPNRERPAEYFYQNLMMGTLLLHHACRNGVAKFVAAGAGCGYPEHATSPLKEADLWSGFPQQESAPYSLAKRLLTIQAEAYSRQFGLVSIIGIPGNIYGPYDNFHLLDAHVIPALVRKFVEAVQTNAASVEIWGTGQATRDFVYAGDAADGLLRAAELLERTDVINLSSGRETSIRQVVDLLRNICGYGGRIDWNTSRPDGQLQRCFDVSKAKLMLGWTAATPLAEGLLATVDWYRAHQHEARK